MLWMTDEYRQAFLFIANLYRNAQQRPPIDYARLGYKHKKRPRKGKR